MGIPVFALFAFLWYFPLFRKHRKNVQEPLKYYWAAFGMGIAAFIASMLIQLIVGFLTRNISFSVIGKEIFGFFNVIITVAVTEELTKFFLGKVVINRVPDLTEAGCMLILGMTGMGFETLESVLNFDIITALLRGLTALHIFFQIWMGKFWFKALCAKNAGNIDVYKKNTRICFLWPIAVHAIFDYIILKAVSLVENGFITEVTGVIMAGTAILLAILAMTAGLITARRTLREEQSSKFMPQ